MKKQGARSLGCQIHSDEQSFNLCQELYELIGMKISQTKKRYFINNNLFKNKNDNRLRYKSLEETGKKLFIKILRKVTEGTLDREYKLDIAQQGAEKAAYNHLKSYKSIDNALNNMFLAYKNDEIIGLIIPQLLKDNLGAINYIGVIPAERGKGYVIDLLDKGIRNLLKRNVNKILADIDVLNFPMENALKKVGFRQEKKLINYRLSL